VQTALGFEVIEVELGFSWQNPVGTVIVKFVIFPADQEITWFATTCNGSAFGSGF
jgi:hypothetical protein